MSKTQTKPFQYFRDASPKWMTDEAVHLLMNGTLETDETPLFMYERLATTAASYYPGGLGKISQIQLFNDFRTILLNGWLSPATPVAANFGTRGSGLPVSCFGLKPENSIYGIFTAAREMALLSKHGGGLGVNLSALKGASNVKEWLQIFDKVANKVNQGGTRRGAMAAYLSVHHPNINSFLDAIDLLDGDHREKIDSKIGIMFDHAFFLDLRAGQEYARQTWNKVLKLRMKYGFPYIQFVGNSQDADPQWYKDLGLQSGSSQLCSEIFLHQDHEHTYSCVLSSINAAKKREWETWLGESGLTLAQLAIIFLDAVNEEFVVKGSKIPGLENAVRGAIKGRPLGLGVLGLHALYMGESVPFESAEARLINTYLFYMIKSDAEEATRLLAQHLGEPEWCKRYFRRNTHLIAVAPTTSSSLLCNGGSPGIEPIIANYFAVKGDKATAERRNVYLERVLEELGQNHGSVWASIRENSGSVQHLDFLSDHQKAVFKTAFEIDQFEVIRQAADRQEFIDQGQSLNLFIRPEASAQRISDIHLAAYDQGLKSVYYLRSESILSKINKDSEINYVHLKTRDDCPYCDKAKALLDSKGIEYTTEYKETGRVPEIWIKGEKLSNGYESLVKRFLGSVEAPEDDCVACSG